MPAGDLIYKCKSCGASEALYYCPADLYLLLDYALGLARPPVSVDVDKLPSRYATHKCRDGTRGVMDLIGARPVADPPPGVEAQASKCRSQDAA
jgi:hypothetical protein